MEEWRDIQGYEGLYQVSSCGRVKSLNYNHTGIERILTQTTDNKGYKRINLYKDGKRKIYLVHRLVATLFIENPNDYPEVNHKDECKYNNYVENLEWCTRKYNNYYGTRLERISKTMTGKNHADFIGSNNPRARKVQASTGEIFNTVKDAAEWCNTKNLSNISGQIRGKQKTAGKHPVTKEKLQWKYID